jgi:hypothetical protein
VTPSPPRIIWPVLKVPVLTTLIPPEKNSDSTVLNWIPPLEIRSAARTRTKLNNSAGLDSDGAWSDGARSAVCKRFEVEKAGRVLNVDTRSGLDAMCTINKTAIDTGLGIQEVGVVMVAEPNSWIIPAVVA